VDQVGKHEVPERHSPAHRLGHELIEVDHASDAERLLPNPGVYPDSHSFIPADDS
jgi:hypothetical protein